MSSSINTVTIVAKDGSFEIKKKALMLSPVIRDALSVKQEPTTDNEPVELIIHEDIAPPKILLTSLEHLVDGFPQSLQSIGLTCDIVSAYKLADKYDVDEVFKAALIGYVAKVNCDRKDQETGTIAFEVMKASFAMNDTAMAFFAVANLDKIAHPAHWQKEDAKPIGMDAYFDIMSEAKKLQWVLSATHYGRPTIRNWRELARRLQDKQDGVVETVSDNDSDVLFP